MTRIMIVGGGRGGVELIKLLSGNDAVEIVCVVDTDLKAPGMELARRKGILVSTSYLECLEKCQVDEVFNVTGRDDVQNKLLSLRPKGVEVIGGHSSKLIWQLMEEWKKSVAEAKDTRDFMEHIFRITPSAIFIVDRDRKVVKWNRRAEELTGYSAEDMLGKECRLFAVDPCMDKCGLYSDDVAKPISGCECTIRRKDGVHCTITKNADFLRDANGTIIGGIESFDDVTERKEAEMRAKNVAKEWSATFDSIEDLISIQDSDYRIIRANKAFARTFNMTPEEVEGKLCYEVVHGTEEPWPECPFSVVLETGDAQEREFFEPRLGVYLAVTTSPLFDQNGKVTGTVHIAKDITKRKETEEEISFAYDQMNQIFENAGDGMWLLDNEGAVLKVNGILLSMLGKTRDGVLFNKHDKLLSGTMAEINVRIVNDVLAGRDRVERDVVLEVGGFARMHCILTATPLIGSGGKRVGVIETLKDISSRKAAEEALVETMKIRDNFTSVVSHELRTPLTAIKEGIAIVLDGSAGEINEEQKDFLDAAKRNIDRLGRLINDVLDFAKLRSGKMEIKAFKNDVMTLLEDIIKFEEPHAAEKGLYIKSELERTLPKVEFDPDRLTQVMTNLLNNALKFTEEGGVVIRAYPEDKGVVISVDDTGPGIERAEMANLFKEFQQLKIGNQRKTGGTGLGLAISKEIIRRHKGRIWVESEPGKGASFRIWLPVERKYRIVVIDDDGVFRKLCEDLLVKSGYSVDVAATGEEGLRKIRKEDTDLVVMDMRLPDINGYEILGRLQSDMALKDIPVLAVSGFEEELKGLDELEGAEGVSSVPKMIKPFDNNEFLKKIESLLKMSVR